MFFCPPAFHKPRTALSLHGILTNLGLTSGLQICLDAGALASYNPTVDADEWKDLSGNGYHFGRGGAPGSDAADPTFNGTPGGLSANEYFSFDGGDYFTLAQANPAWINNLHRDNAIFSFLVWQRLPNVNGIFGVLGTNGGGATSGSGVHVSISNTTDLVLMNVATSGTGELALQTTGTVTREAWRMVAGGLNEATGSNGADLVINGSAESFTSTYASPAAVDASFPLQIGSRGNADSPARNGWRVAMVAMWSGVRLNTTQIGNIYDATKGRFGL